MLYYTRQDDEVDLVNSVNQLSLSMVQFIYLF